MRRVLQPAHTPRPLHEYATKKSWPHFSQRARANPCARIPHSKYFRRSRSTYAGTGSTAQSAPASSPLARRRATQSQLTATRIDTPHAALAPALIHHSPMHSATAGRAFPRHASGHTHNHSNGLARSSVSTRCLNTLPTTATMVSHMVGRRQFLPKNKR